MALTCCLLKPIPISASSPTGDSGKVFLRPDNLAMVVSPHQTYGPERQKLQALDSEHVSRRKSMMYLTAGVVSGLVFLTGEAAEARVGRNENRRKALQKLRERSKAASPKSGKQEKEGFPPQEQQQAIETLVMQ